jgi:hypothetical protein
MTVVFSDRVYPDRIRLGLALSDLAFDLIEPLLAKALPVAPLCLDRTTASQCVTPAHAASSPPQRLGNLPSPTHNRAPQTRALADWIEHLNRAGRRIGIEGY